MNGKELMHAPEIQMMQKQKERIENLTRDNLKNLNLFAIFETS
jgi:hypothetical protein